MLNRQGWWLLDDSWAAVRTADGWITGRSTRDPTYQDGWFFGYGHDYATALSDLRVLTGAATLPPQWMSGVWYSVYDAVPARTYEQELLPAFAAHDVPVDGLSVDTDWKSPVRWDGWEWNRRLFPDPDAFFAWARSQRLAVVLNVHAGLSGRDRALGQVQRELGRGAGQGGSVLLARLLRARLRQRGARPGPGSRCTPRTSGSAPGMVARLVLHELDGRRARGDAGQLAERAVRRAG